MLNGVKLKTRTKQEVIHLSPLPSTFIINVIDYLLTFLSTWRSWSKNISVVVSLVKPVHPFPGLSVLVFDCSCIGFITSLVLQEHL